MFEEFDLSKPMFHEIVYKKVGCWKVSSPWIPKQMTEEQFTWRHVLWLGFLYSRAILEQVY